MSSVVVEHVSHLYGTLTVLRNVSLRLGPGDRVGVVGPNGQGKTTLIHVLAGELTPTAGSIQRRRGLTMGLLPQEPPALSDQTIYGAMSDVFGDVREIERQLQDAAAGLDSGDGDALARYGQLQEQFESCGGYGWPNRIDQVLTGLGFDRELWNRPLAQLSGGQRTRAYLAKLLLAQPDLLMLDEPTNHLDIDSVEWLERWLSTATGILVVVSHDRYFLNAVTTTTWDVAHGAVEIYRGNYSDYLPKRQARYDERLKQYDAQQSFIARQQDFIARNLAGQRSKEAQGRRTRLERFVRDEAIERPLQPQEIGFSITPSRRSGDIVLKCQDIAVGYSAGSPIVQAQQLEVRRGQKIAIVGANGSGKTTLLRTLLGELAPLGGKVRHGSNVDTGYLSQNQAELDGDVPAADALVARGGVMPERARTILGALGLSGEAGIKPISQLSGGQRSRVTLAWLAISGPNFLMLDEPTNHLDIPSTEIVQRVLADFDGAVLFVSHDRFLVDAVATDIWVIADGAVRPLRGGWKAYVDWRTSLTAAAPAAPVKATASKKEPLSGAAAHRESRRNANRVQRLQRRHAELLGLIDAGESELADLTHRVTRAGQDGDVALVTELGLKYQQVKDQLDQMLAEWEQVGEELS